MSRSISRIASSTPLLSCISAGAHAEETPPARRHESHIPDTSRFAPASSLRSALQHRLRAAHGVFVEIEPQFAAAALLRRIVCAQIANRVRNGHSQLHGRSPEFALDAVRSRRTHAALVRYQPFRLGQARTTGAKPPQARRASHAARWCTSQNPQVESPPRARAQPLVGST